MGSLMTEHLAPGRTNSWLSDTGKGSMSCHGIFENPEDFIQGALSAVGVVSG
jgi:hypothetical protein